MGNDQSRLTRSLLHAWGKGRENAGRRTSPFLYLVTEHGCPVDNRTVRESLRPAGVPLAVPFDWCCVRNFQEATRPRIIALPAGKGAALHRDMESLIVEVNLKLRRALLSEAHQQEIREIRQRFDQQEQSLARSFCSSMKRHDLTVLVGGLAQEIRPEQAGKPLSSRPRAGDGARVREGLPSRRDAGDYRDEDFRMVRERIRSIKHQCSEETRHCTERAARKVIAPLAARLRKKYRGFPRVLIYLEDMEQDILKNLTAFTLPLRSTVRTCQGEDPSNPDREKMFSPCSVTVLAGRSDRTACPVIFVRNPDHEELLGCIPSDDVSTHRHAGAAGMRGGIIHEANGGCLVVEASWILRNIPLWELIKETARKREHVITTPTLHTGIVASGNRVSESMPLDLAVVVTGTRVEYAVLSLVDPEFIGLTGNPWHLAKGSFTQVSPEKNPADRYSPPCHPSARQAILQLCARHRISDDHLAEHLETILHVIEKACLYAGVQEVTARHISLAFEDAYLGSSSPPESEVAWKRLFHDGRTRHTVEPDILMEQKNPILKKVRMYGK